MFANKELNRYYKMAVRSGSKVKLERIIGLVAAQFGADDARNFKAALSKAGLLNYAVKR